MSTNNSSELVVRVLAEIDALDSRWQKVSGEVLDAIFEPPGPPPHISPQDLRLLVRRTADRLRKRDDRASGRVARDWDVVARWGPQAHERTEHSVLLGQVKDMLQDGTITDGELLWEWRAEGVAPAALSAQHDIPLSSVYSRMHGALEELKRRVGPAAVFAALAAMQRHRTLTPSESPSSQRHTHKRGLRIGAGLTAAAALVLWLLQPPA